MIHEPSRRGFLAQVGRGTLLATLGPDLASDLQLADANEFADEPPDRLHFGEIEPLVAFMQETPLDRLIPGLIKKWNSGTDSRTLLKAAALANARTFGGEDYIGFHTMMAMEPAWRMSEEIRGDRSLLPILKVIYRNTARIHDFGGPAKEVLKTVKPAREGPVTSERLREIVRSRDMNAADAAFVAIADDNWVDALDAVICVTADNTEVHRTVMPYRAWQLLQVIGPENAETLLRQSVHYCVKSERDWPHSAETDEPRRILPALMDRYKLAGRSKFPQIVDEIWAEGMSEVLFESTPQQAADAAAEALAEGIHPVFIGQAIALAANQLILRDKGRPAREVQPGKPEGSVHGDSIGVHASDSANAWRNLARFGNDRNQVACVILGAYQVAHDRTSRGGDFDKWEPRPLAAEIDRISISDQPGLLAELDNAIRGNDQKRACAITGRWAQLGFETEPISKTFLKYAVSEDGALHAEKFYQTVQEDMFCVSRDFRWRFLHGLARVTASEYGRRAAGYEEACERLGLKV